MTSKNPRSKLRVGLVVPHIFMHRAILPGVIFSPGHLALGLAAGLQKLGAKVTLFSPGPIDTHAANHTADLSYFETELAGRGDSYLELLKKHPFTFITLARQAQSELIAEAYAAANRGELDVVHIYTNEEDIALPFAQFCRTPVVFTHHDPFNFLVKYKNIFPKYKRLNWLSMSNAQREGMPEDTNWLATIYHGLDAAAWQPNYQPEGNYIAYLGRVIEPKGVHLAIAAVKHYNQQAKRPLKLKIAGKHYTDHKKDAYWREKILPELSDTVEYVGFLRTVAEKQSFLGSAQALMMPSTFNEPFGLSMIEALACGTPIIGLSSGAIPEVVRPHHTGLVVPVAYHMDQKSNWLRDDDATAKQLAGALAHIGTISRHACRRDFEARFTLERMCREHLRVYQQLA